MYGSGTTPLNVSNEGMEDTMKIVKSFVESRLLIKKSVKHLNMKQNNKKHILVECY